MGIFEDRPELYDALVDWPKRLANEEPLFRRFFQEVGARRVLDVACGSGRHAHLFHSWGLEVVGADISSAMIEHCRRAYGETDSLHWVVRPFDAPVEEGPVYDAVLCVGNSLALAPELDTVSRAVAAMMGALRPGGVCVIGVLNLWRIPEGPATWQTCRRVMLDGESHVLIKGIHRAGRRAYLEFIDVRTETTLLWGSATSTLLGLEAEELTAMVTRSGGAQVDLLGSVKGEPYDRQRSGDLILICRRAG